MTDEKNTPSDEHVEAVEAPTVEPADAGTDATADAVPAESPSASSAEQAPHADEAPTAPAAPVQYGVGPLSIRETALTGVWAIAFVVSFFPSVVTFFPRFAIAESVWSAGIEWVLGIGLPTAAVFLVLLRRFSPQGIRRVGSLAIDQFASVAFSVSAVVWLTALWSALVDWTQRGIFTATWVTWVEFFLMVLGVALTVFAPFLPVLSEDFRHRDEASAHPNARPIRPISPRPAPVVTPVSHHAPQYAPTPEQHAPESYAPVAQPVAEAHAPAAFAPAATEPTDDQPTDAYAPQQWSAPETTSTDAAPFAYVTDSASEPVADPAGEPSVPVQQAFWALVPEERDVLDEQGAPLFRIGPTAWALVIEDRGEAFVVRHEDGRIGYLHDVSGVTRG